MEIKLQEDLREIVTEMPEQRKRLPVSLEAVVPDSQEDLSRIALLRAAAFLKSKEPTARGLLVQGELRAAALGVGESGRWSAVPLSKPFELEFELGESLPEERCQVRFQLGNMEARLVNPRKISALFELTATLDCFASESLCLSAQAEASPGLHLRYEDGTIPTAVASAEKSFVLSQQMPLSERPETLLYALPELIVEEMSPLGSRAIVKGRLLLELGFDSEGEPGFRSLSAPFSQIVELPTEDAEQFRATAALCSCYAELSDSIGGERVLEAEVHGLLQLTAYRSQSLHLPTDAYSNLAPLQLERRTLSLRTRAPLEPLSLTAEGKAELPEDWASAVALLPGPIQAEQTDRELRLWAPVDLIYRTRTGELGCIRRNVNTQTRLPAQAELLALSVGELELSGNALSLPLRAELCAGDTQELERLTGLSWDPAEAYDPAKLPAVVLARGGPEDTWELARRWHSTQERIRDMNQDAAPGDLLLIVRERL